MVMTGIFDREDGRARHASPELIGRGWESARLDSLLERSRLVTVVGLGGVGKSALAADAVERVGRTGTTVVAVDMAGFNGVEQVFHAVGRSSSEALLLVDNCDRLPGPAAAALSRLLEARPGLRVLITSRRRLGAADETVLPLAPMQLNDAVSLLELRARQLGTPLPDNEEARVTAGRICLRLDCLPLALGLAAGRLPDRGPRELLARLSERGGPLGLSGVGTDIPGRHRTLRHCHGWSHELCVAQERLLWARLSAFGGTFTRTAAERVCEDEQLSRPEIATAVDGLVGQGLLEHVNERPELLRMPRTVQDYGAEWLTRLGEETRLLERVLMWSRGLL
ncbi:hypothetical protein [Streptomyces axinellae]|uniref:NB-ARC domain-containing protein n=1 Tax=Streptomyces axinellae TaxID=552788 RepID=A0ABP6D702_9ACTN